MQGFVEKHGRTTRRYARRLSRDRNASIADVHHDLGIVRLVKNGCVNMRRDHEIGVLRELR